MLYLFIFAAVQTMHIQNLMIVYGAGYKIILPNENNEIIRENSQKKLYVLAAHQIALWEYDIPTGKCSFTDDYFRTLGLKEV